MISRVITTTLLAGFVLAAATGAATAQQPTQAQGNAIRQSCRSDFQAQCSGVPTGGQAALSCLQSHMAQLSPGCQAAVGATMGGGSTTGGSASAPPATSPPGGTGAATRSPAGQGGTSPQERPRERAGAMRAACGQDFRTYCHGVQLGGGRAMECLKENESRLSAPCRSALGQMGGG